MTSELLERPLVWGIVAEPLLATADQRFVLGHSGIIHAWLPSQGNRYRVAFGVFRITAQYVIRANRDRDFVGFIYDGQAIEFIFRHHALLILTHIIGGQNEVFQWPAGRDGFPDALRGSTTERVLRRAPCPVLAIPTYTFVSEWASAHAPSPGHLAAAWRRLAGRDE